MVQKIILFFLLVITSNLLAQQPPDESPPDESPPDMMISGEAPAGSRGEHAGDRSWTAIEVMLCGAVLVFAVFVLILETIIIVKSRTAWSPNSIIRMLGLTLILLMSVLLIAAGYSKDQTSPVMGLLGVIAGYLLGNNERATEKP